MQANVDGADQGDTISENELQRHLQSLMKGHRVTEWVADAIGLPQYVPVFKDNLITVLDFPLLVNDGGASLKSDLGITSKLHRQQLVRAIKRVILGLGAVPGMPQDLQCKQAPGGGLEITWQPPKTAGHPPFHKYKLQRTSDPDGLSEWRSVNRQVDVEATSWLDRKLQEGSYRYRLTAWNAYGWSEDALSPVCLVNASSGVGGTGVSSAEDELHEQPEKADRGGMRLWGMLALSVLTVTVVGAVAHWKGQRDAMTRHPGSSASLSSLDAATRDDSRAVQTPDPDRRERIFWKTDSGRSVGSEGDAAGRRVQFAPIDSGLSDSHRQSFGDLAGLDRPAGLPPLRVDSGKRLAFSNPQPTAFPSHGLNGGEAVEQWLDGPSSSRLARNLSDRSTGQDSGAGPLSDDDMPETPAGVDRWQCGQAGCHRRFGRYSLRDMRHAMQRHFCCVCQRVFCHHHTAYSPHGPFGSCGMESQCICDGCFATLPRATQERLKKTNKLVKKPSKSSGAGEAGKEGTPLEGSASKADKSATGLKALLRGLSGKSNASNGGTREAVSHSGSEAQLEGLDSRSGSSTSRRGRKRSAAEQWSYARSAVGAIVRFREAGRKRASHDGGEQQQKQIHLPGPSEPT
ncbi:g5145 [Coccomyxa viridis]|uniref:G5145 protein n=1 Tax=Coccomyxa viridis TaxID=1274662 RepID=A0ABP1FS35_9CHLO